MIMGHLTRTKQTTEQWRDRVDQIDIMDTKFPMPTISGTSKIDNGQLASTRPSHTSGCDSRDRSDRAVMNCAASALLSTLFEERRNLVWEA